MTKRTPGPDPFNNPFGKVKLTAPETAARAAPPAAKKEKPVALDAEAAMFLEAVGEVAVVKRAKNRAAAAEQPRVDPVKVAADESESLAQLAELVASDGRVELHGVEGQVPGLDPQVMQRLRAGQFAVGPRLDLRGLASDLARQALEKFIAQARNDAQRCVQVIGADSLPQALAKGRLARHVLAFWLDGATAHVLLRR